MNHLSGLFNNHTALSGHNGCPVPKAEQKHNKLHHSVKPSQVSILQDIALERMFKRQSGVPKSNASSLE